MGSKFQTSQLTTCRPSLFSLSSEPPLPAVTTSTKADTPASVEMTESTSETPTLSSSAPTETLTFSHVPQDPETPPTEATLTDRATDTPPTDTDAMPTDQTSTETRTDMPPVPPTMTDTDTVPQLTVAQPTEVTDMMLPDTEESTRSRSARRSDLTPTTTGTKHPVSFLLW